MGWMNICFASPIQKIETTDAPAALGAYSQALSIDWKLQKT